VTYSISQTDLQDQRQASRSFKMDVSDFAKEGEGVCRVGSAFGACRDSHPLECGMPNIDLLALNSELA